MINDKTIQTVTSEDVYKAYAEFFNKALASIVDKYIHKIDEVTGKTFDEEVYLYYYEHQYEDNWQVCLSKIKIQANLDKFLKKTSSVTRECCRKVSNRKELIKALSDCTRARLEDSGNRGKESHWFAAHLLCLIENEPAYKTRAEQDLKALVEEDFGYKGIQEGVDRDLTVLWVK